MLSGKFFLAVGIITMAISLIQWFFIGFLFHKYQASTPSTWRKESSRSYAASTFISLFFAAMFAVIFYLWKNKYGPVDILDGIEFGAVLWLTFSVTTEVGNAVYVNYSPMFVLGKCISSLIEYTTAGILAAVIIP